MRVLLLESEEGSGAWAQERLVDAGHTVRRCHEPGENVFPCAALRSGRTCPLEEGVDVALLVRREAHDEPTALEDGVACALRNHVPLVLAGWLVPSPYTWHAAALAGHDVVTACDVAGAAPLRAQTNAALGSFRLALQMAGVATDGIAAAVHRDGDRLRVDLRSPHPLPDDLEEVVAVRAVRAVREIDRSIAKIDVEVTSG